MKLVARVLAAGAILALAAPALACGEMKQTTTASTQTKEAQPAAKAEKKAAKPAKSQQDAKKAPPAQAQTAQN